MRGDCMEKFMRLALVLAMAVSICGISYAQDDGGGSSDSGGESYSDAGSSSAEDAADSTESTELADAGDEVTEVRETEETYAEHVPGTVSSTHTTVTGTTHRYDSGHSALDAAIVGGVVGASVGAAAASSASNTRGAGIVKKVAPARKTTVETKEKETKGKEANEAVHVDNK